MFNGEVDDIPHSPLLICCRRAKCDIGGDDSLEKLAKQKHHLESRKFTKSKLDVRESIQDGQINQEIDPKTDNDEKVPD